MKINALYFINVAAVMLLVIGVVLLLVASRVRASNADIQTQPAFTPENSAQQIVDGPDVKQGRPISLTISDVSIDSDIVDGVFDKNTGQWTLTLDKVQYAVMTNLPNDQQGMTFLYGHNRKGVFQTLPKIEEGAIAEVETENGYKFLYRFKDSRRTSPEDVSVFSYEGSPILVLQTCVGMFFQYRQLFTFEFIGVDGNA